ncbi:MAG: hypothetical protein QM778_30810 [Myxococcales bacterium]
MKFPAICGALPQRRKVGHVLYDWIGRLELTNTRTGIGGLADNVITTSKIGVSTLTRCDGVGYELEAQGNDWERNATGATNAKGESANSSTIHDVYRCRLSARGRRELGPRSSSRVRGRADARHEARRDMRGPSLELPGRPSDLGGPARG